MRRYVKIYEEVGDSVGFVELVDHLGSDQTVVDAARVSFSSDLKEKPRWRPEKDPKLLRYLIRNDHWSPFEHCTITWCVNVPLFVRGQWHRHRTWSYNEVSRRYTAEDLEFYTPLRFRSQSQDNKQGSDWSGLMDPNVPFYSLEDEPDIPASAAVERASFEAVRVYHVLLGAGVAREQARMVLPQNMYTRFYATVNLRNALAFLRLREDHHAQWEIYKAAEAMRHHMEYLFPESMAAWGEVSGGGDGR